MAPSQETTLRSDDSQGSAAPQISLPKGGGAVRGIGEKFTANPVTGTGSMSVPINVSPGRSGFGPQLSLSYDSGSGNGPFGFGWSLALPSITRKTDKGLPQYQDGLDSDVFILSGAEDLVPALKKAATGWQRDEGVRTSDGVPFRVRLYRPRIEGLFARIERWTNTETGDTHWRSISPANISTVYGRTAESRITDPSDSSRVFSWLICESYDDKGNAIVYRYEAENSAGVDYFQAHERNRTEETRSVNRYLKRIKYGNVLSRLVHSDLESMEWLFEVVLDYGEGHVHELPSGPQGQQFVMATEEPANAWPVRKDPFSSYRAGFEVRTYRLCRRVLMFHHFPNELGMPSCLVSSMDFTHDEDSVASFLTGSAQSGYVHQSGGVYLKKSLPPLEFDYSKAQLNTQVMSLAAESLEHLPAGVDGARYQPLDMDGEGLTGVLMSQAQGWYYKRNMSPLPAASTTAGETAIARFAPARLMARQPSVAALGAGGQQFLDLAGDGQVDLVQFGADTAGFYERTRNDGWAAFVPFSSMPNTDVDDPNARFIDLTGDGHADMLITEQDALVWHPSLAETGFGEARRVPQALDEEKGPRLVFADGTESIHLADLSGDGLTDLVRIRNGEVCYWPNLGYGRFGPKVTMSGAPWFDAPDQFEQRRLRLGDLDGSGTTDIFYLGRHEITIWRNESGNGWSAPLQLPDVPRTDALVSVLVLDLLGNGTACLVWSSQMPGETRPMRYIDLMGGQKPHLLVAARNNLGAETRVHYVPSTKFYLADQVAGRPWITRLPFPVHVVERVETYDHLARNRFVTRYAYHHGYFDGAEREFRGFGMVEQWDTEELAALGASGASSNAPNFDEASHVPPVLTRTWFHTGVYLDGSRVSQHFEKEYYRESDSSLGQLGLSDAQLRAMLLPDTLLPADLSVDEGPEACRALKGSLLRTEVYALDDTEAADRPYLVSEHSYAIKRHQPRAGNKHAVFSVHARESIDFHYERRLYETSGGKRADPRVRHGVTLEVDDYGNVLLSAAIGYGRRFDDPAPALTAADREKQKKTYITLTANTVTNAVLEPDAFRVPVVCETRTFEVLNAKPAANLPGITNLFNFDELVALVAQASDGQHDLPYEDITATGATGGAPFRRLIEHTRTLFRRDDLTDLLPLGQLQSRALPGESYTLALTSGLLSQIFVVPGKASLAELAEMLEHQNAGGYVHSDGDTEWWSPAGRLFYSADPGDLANLELDRAREHFFLPARFRDPFGNATTVSYDAYDLMPAVTTDPLGNTLMAEYDYRVLRPRRITDANGNRSEAAFDALGMVVGTAVMGKAGENAGDTLSGFATDLDDTVLLAHAADPLSDPHSILQGATTRLAYDVFAYLRTQSDPQPQPAVVYTLIRETHVSDLAPGQQARVQHSFSYSDGFGREIQRKIQAEPGPLEESGPAADPRWVGSGWTVFNNKGKSVRQYEPFFSATHRFEFANTVGVSPVLLYDPVERVVATLHPDHSWEKVVFDPWRQESWDSNDTALIADPKTDVDVGHYFERLPVADYLPSWHASRVAGTTAEQDAAKKVEAHAATPTVNHADSLGRVFLSIADNGAAGSYRTRTELDIESNALAVTDALERSVIRHDYAVSGDMLHSASMEAGERWVLHDAAGQPIARWDSRGHRLRYIYDALRRPTEVWLRAGSAPEALVQRTVYGEAKGESLDHRTRVYQVLDGAGIVTSEEYDFKGNLRLSNRRLASEYKGVLDWSAEVVLEAEVFSTRTEVDALNRPTALTTPDGSVIRPTYNEANLLERIEANLLGSPATVVFVDDIDYNAKGQRTSIAYGNAVHTTFAYDERTFRLARLHTIRGGASLQDLRYTYDPAGNITSIRDDAIDAIYFNNSVVDAHASYTYDAVYRLILASGREHIGQTSEPESTWDDRYRTHLQHPHNGQAMRRYTEGYAYDAVGNILEVVHQVANGGWTRTYSYDEPSQLEPTRQSNRLSATTVGSSTAVYGHDIHGSMTGMSHLSLMQWDYLDRLVATSQQVANGATPEATYYVYDAAGQRVRKVIERAANPGATPVRKSERIYAGGFEVYREYAGTGELSLQRDSLHVLDGESRVALVDTREFGDDGSPAQLVRYQLSNHLGSAALELDDEGQIISYEEYYPYGSTSYQAGRSVAEVSCKRYRYTGKERDEETGLSYHGARYYAPWLGRWTSCDPAATADGTNLYRYGRGMPTTIIDPTGTQGRTIIEESEIRLVNKRTGKLETIDRTKTTILADTTVEGSSATETIELPELVVAGDDPELVTAAAEHGWSVEAERFYRHTPGVIQQQDILGFTKGLINSPAATIEGLGAFAGFNLDLSALKLTVPPEQESGAFLGEALGPGPSVVVGKVSKAAKLAAQGLRLEAKGDSLVSAVGELMRDKRGALDLNALAKLVERAQPLTKEEQKAAAKATAVLRETGSTSEAGTAYHSATNAAGPGEGVDFVTHGGAFQREVATHYGPVQAFQFESKSKQSLKYSLQYQEKSGLVPIRDVVHVYIDPRTGKSVKIHKP